jgi:fructose/tagatose bisphosphate aldolase
MPLITRRDTAAELTQHFRQREASMAVFCTASHWNTEAILLACQQFAEQHHLAQVPVSVALTFTYPSMPQAQRMTYTGDPRVGFLSHMGYLRALCEGAYPNVSVLPHLDHADPKRDRWALTEGLPYLASVMFDAQKYPLSENIALTTNYVQQYGEQVLIEGILEELRVAGHESTVKHDTYVTQAVDYLARTRVDFLVADLGTEQQSDHQGSVTYLKDRALLLTAQLGDKKLVLHGTSSLSAGQMLDLASDGVIRVNIWTRIVREAGQYAARQLIARQERIITGDFEAVESRQYLQDSTEAAARIMFDILEQLGYARLGL